MLWLKALHLIFMVTWLAGLFCLPRLYVNHAVTEDEAGRERFKVMERKPFFAITTPGGVLTLVFGIWMLVDYPWVAYAQTGWLPTKLLLVAILVVYHVAFAKFMLDFKHERNRRSHVFYRRFNEQPVLILVAVVLLATLEPF